MNSTTQHKVSKVSKRTELLEYQEYVKMLLIYKREKSEYPKFVKLGLENSANPLERLQFYERKKKNSEICKTFYKIRTAYQEAAARLECKAKGIDLTAFDIAKLANIEIPVSMNEIIQDTRMQKFVMSAEGERMKQDALAYMNKGLHEVPASVEQDGQYSFIENSFENSNDNDPTFEDYAPITQTENISSDEIAFDEFDKL